MSTFYIATGVPFWNSTQAGGGGLWPTGGLAILAVG
jgi:hypothetical protein